MTNPKALEWIHEGYTLWIPTYEIHDGEIKDGIPTKIEFCKGSISDPNIQRQNGFFTESLIMAAKMFLEAVNKGELATRENSMAITKLDEGLMWLQKRTDDRKLKGTLGTYNK